MALPVSAFAESFTVTTNKGIYTPDEKAIIVGTISEEAPAGHAILIQVTGARGDCAAMNILPAADNSFISRPIQLDACGFGEFTVSAFYADQQTTSTFVISNSSQTDEGNNLELRVLKNVMLQAQDAVNKRVKELIEGGYVLPEEVVTKYSEGVSEASLALQAIEFGDAAEAKKHMIFAVRDFREVLNALSEDVARFEQTEEQQSENDGNSGIVGTYRMLREYYFRLQDLAEKNQVDREDEFRDAAMLLSNARRMIDEGNFEGAELNLERVSIQLEAIRSSLVDEGESERLTSSTNATSPEDEESARRLTNAADKFEGDALELLNQTVSNPDLQAKVQEALLLIAGARASIEAQDLDSAKDALSAAHSIIEEVKDRIKEDERGGNTSNSGNDSGESSNDDKDSDSGEGRDKDESDEDSDKSDPVDEILKKAGVGGNDDEDDQ